MTKEDFIKENIIDRAYGDENAKKELYEYLCGNTKKEPNVKKLSLYGAYYSNLGAFIFKDSYISSNGLEDIAEELKEAETKFFEIFSRTNPDGLSRAFEGVVNRYKYYSLTKLSENFVKSDLKFTINRCLTYNYRTWESHDEQIMLNNSIKEVDKYYDKLIYNFISNFKNYNSDIVTIMLLLIKKIHQKDSQYMKFLGELEIMFYSLIKLSFDDKEIKETFDKYIESEEAKNYYETFKPINMPILPVHKHVLLFIATNMCIEFSNLLKIGAKISYILFDSEFIHARTKSSNDNDDYWNISAKLNLPNEAIIKYCMAGISVQYEPSNIYNEKLNDILNKNYEDLKNTLDKFINKDSLYACILLAYMLKNDKIGESEKEIYIESINNIIIKYMKEKDNKKESFITLYNNTQYSYNSFKEIEFSVEEALEDIGQINFYTHNANKLFLSSLFLLDYSIVARNLTKLSLPNFPNCSYRVNYFKSYEAFCYNKDMNTYEKFYKMGFPLSSIVEIFLKERITSVINENIDKEMYKKEFIKFLKEHKTEAEEGIEKFDFVCSISEAMVNYIELLYTQDNGFDLKYVVKALKRKSKPLADYVEKFLIPKEKEIRCYIEEILNSKSKIEADVSMRLIRIWDNEKIQEELQQIKDLNDMVHYIKKIYTKNNDKNTPYSENIDYSDVRAINSEEKVPQILIKYYISEYIMLKELYVINICKKIEEFINIFDLKKLIKNIFEMWVSEEYKAKYKNIIIPLALTATENQISEIKSKIDFWCDNSKPSLAAFAVQSLCMNGSKMALLLVDTMSKKHKNKRVRTAALEAIERAIKEFGITKEELEDLIVPDLGFNKDRKRIFDYGERKFTAIINEKLEVTLYDSNNKEIKSLPKVSTKYNDNEGMVNTCKEDLKLTKKQLKTIFEAQKPRISNAVMSGRKWQIHKWKTLFIENPIMTCFATGLIWEELDATGNLIGTFRYMEDGTFNTSDEEEYELSNASFIALLHPVDIEQEKLEEWKQQIEDYEIIQPVEQLNIPIYKLNQENRLKTEIDDFENKKVYGATFKSISTKLGLSPCFDGYGDYEGCMYKYSEKNIIMRIYTTAFYIGDYSAVTTLGKIVFYFDEEEQKQISKIQLENIPAKLLSFAMFTGNMITAKTVE